jgi:hypothetical protein
VSNGIAIAGVTAVLLDLLNVGFNNHNVSGMLGTVDISALPPDRLLPTSGTESTQLNLFLHQVTPNLGWSNERLPSRDDTGRIRLTNQYLALDLHYLLSAFAAENFHAEILLGLAMQLLHETPVLSRTAITNALNPPPPLTPLLQALADCGLADQVEQIKITPEYLSTDEMSKLWTAVESHYRPSTAYLATVVLIESVQPTRPTLPVLSRGPVDPVTGRDRGVVVEPSLLPPFPTIESAVPTSKQPAASVGETVDITGHHLDGTNRVIVLSNTRFQIEEEVTEDFGGSSTLIKFTVPNPPPHLPVGIYQLAVRVIRPGESEPRTSNHLALIIGPAITSGFPIIVELDGSSETTFELACEPEVRPGQQVSLLVGIREVLAEGFDSPKGPLKFVVDAALAGDHLVRLRVDGIESPIIDRLATPPVFFNNRIIITT